MGWMYAASSIGRMAGYGLSAAQRADTRHWDKHYARIARGQDPHGVPANRRRGPKLLMLAGFVLFTMTTLFVGFGFLGLAMMVTGLVVLDRRKVAADRYYTELQREAGQE